MNRKLLIALGAVALVGAAYFAMTRLEPRAVMPFAPAETGAVDQNGGNDEAVVATADPEAQPQDANVKSARDRLFIEVAGSVSGTIEIELLNDIAPEHVARIESLAKAGKYDNIVFHRVLDGFMAQTGDVEFGLRGGDKMSSVGMGSSDMPDLKAEFSDEKFVTGTVGMARATSVDSANSQFFIMFGEAPNLDGKYTVVGHVVAGQNIVNAIRKGDSNRNGAVETPDYMKKVSVIAAE